MIIYPTLGSKKRLDPSVIECMDVLKRISAAMVSTDALSILIN
jgi:hypothetical protein